jgi:hypothetical protein
MDLTTNSNYLTAKHSMTVFTFNTLRVYRAVGHEYLNIIQVDFHFQRVKRQSLCLAFTTAIFNDVPG